MSRVQQLSRAVLALSLVGVFSGYALAAGRSDTQQSKGKFSARESNATLERASHLIGHSVKGSDGKTLGTIYDIVLTPDLNSVSYVALSRDGAFGLGRNLYAVPWSLFSMGPGNTYYMSITQNHLLTMKGFNEAYWPTGPSAGWTAANGVAAADQGTTRAQSRDVQNRRVSKLTGINVKDAQSNNSGHIHDFVIAKDSGQVAYTIVSTGGFFGLGAKYAAVPPAAINIEAQRGIAILTVDRGMLTANAFSPGQWPDLSSPSFEQRVATLYGTQPPSGAILGYVPPESSVPEGNVNVEPKTKMPGTKECTKDQGAALGYQAPAVTPQSPGAVNFDFAHKQTIEGTVVDTGKLGGAAAPGLLALRLKTADDKIVTVNLGPRDYISHQNFYIVDGDRIAVTGAQGTLDGRPMVMATDIRSDGQVLHLRDASGHPLWLQSTSPGENEAANAAVNMPQESSTSSMHETPEHAQRCP
jgi:sporulation protein YlmC with PRC-barrel domain